MAVKVDAWIGIIGTVLGIVLGWALTEGSRVLRDRRQARRELRKAAFVCLDRLLKIESAVSAADREQQDSEIYHLGGDLDRYRDCIASGGRWSGHWRVYRMAMPILLRHEVDRLGEAIEAFEAIARATGQ